MDGEGGGAGGEGGGDVIMADAPPVSDGETPNAAVGVPLPLEVSSGSSPASASSSLPASRPSRSNTWPNRPASTPWRTGSMPPSSTSGGGCSASCGPPEVPPQTPAEEEGAPPSTKSAAERAGAPTRSAEPSAVVLDPPGPDGRGGCYHRRTAGTRACTCTGRERASASRQRRRRRPRRRRGWRRAIGCGGSCCFCQCQCRQRGCNDPTNRGTRRSTAGQDADQEAAQVDAGAGGAAARRAARSRIGRGVRRAAGRGETGEGGGTTGAAGKGKRKWQYQQCQGGKVGAGQGAGGNLCRSGGSARGYLLVVVVFFQRPSHYFDKVECTFRTIRKKTAVLAHASHPAPGAGAGVDGTGGSGGTTDPAGATDPDAAAAAAAVRANKSRRQIQMEERAAREAASAAAKKRAAEVAAKRKAEAATSRPETADDLVLGDVTTLTWSRTTDGGSGGNNSGNNQDNRAFHFAYTDTPTAPYTDANTLPDLTDGDRVVCTVTLQRRSGEEHRYVPSKKLCRELFPPLLKDLDKCAWLLDEPWEHTDAAKDERLAEARAVAEAEQKRLEEERRVAEEKRLAIEAERQRIVEERARVKAEKAAARAAKKAADAMKTPAKKRKKAEPGTRKVRCGECLACTRDDCGQCKYCLDKPKFGGSHRMKKPCELRQCTNPKVISVGGGGGSGVTSPGPSPSLANNPAIPGHLLPPSDAASAATTATASSGMMPGMPTAASLGSTGMPGFPSGFPHAAPPPAFPPPQPAQPSAQHLPQVQPQPQPQVQLQQPSIQQPQTQLPSLEPPTATAVPPAGMPIVLPSVPPPGATVAVTAPGLMSALQKSEDKIPKKKKTKAKIKISAQQVKAAASRGSSPTLDETSPAAIAAAKELAAAQEAARKEEERRRKEEKEARKRDAIIKKLDPYHPPLENDIIMPPTLTRSEALRAIFLYIKDNRLQDVSDLSTINNDAKLEELFGCKQMQFSQVNSLLLSRKLLLPANPADSTDKKADAPIKFVYVMSADGADVSTMVDLEEDPMLLLGEDYAPTMMSCDVDVNLPGMFQERTRELMRRIKAREYEYNSARNRAHKALLPSGSNKVDEDIVKDAMEDTVNGRGLSASTNLPVLLALAREAPEGSEVGLQSAADARIADILERLEQKVQAAQACRYIVEACKSGSL